MTILYCVTIHNKRVDFLKTLYLKFWNTHSNEIPNLHFPGTANPWDWQHAPAPPSGSSYPIGSKSQPEEPAFRESG